MEIEANTHEQKMLTFKKKRRKSEAPEARSFVTLLFTAVPSAPQALKVPENRLPVGWWPKVIFGLILAITR